MIWSYSRLTTADDCPYSFWSQYIAKEEQEQNSWGVGGTHTHEIIEKVLLGELPAGEEAATKWLETLPILPFKGMTSTYVANYVEKSYNFIRNFKGVNNKILSVEREFQIEIEGIPIRGFIDLETENEKGIVVTDWKTSAKSGFVGKKLAQKQRQLYLYADAVKKHYGRYPKAMYFYLIMDKEFIKVDWSRKGANEMRRWVVEVVEKASKWENYPPKDKPDFFCSNICGVKTCKHKQYGN
jgi:RecB family exonuclease